MPICAYFLFQKGAKRLRKERRSQILTYAISSSSMAHILIAQGAVAKYIPKYKKKWVYEKARFFLYNTPSNTFIVVEN